MIRTRTTFIVGAGASSELQMPTNEELLTRLGQGLDFSRLGSPVQTRDMVMLSQFLAKLAAMANKSNEDVIGAANRLFTATKLGRSVDAILAQHDNDPLITACGKIAIVHLICQAEAKSILRLTPRIAGDLPVQGTETWLFQLAQIITSGVPRSQVDRCLDNLSIICFNYDRSIEHFLPHAFVMAFGMSLADAQALIAAKLRIIHPYGTVGRLPWQAGDKAEVEWASEAPANIHNLMSQVRTAGEVMRDQNLLIKMRTVVAESRRIAFLGFGFQPLNVDMLIDHGLTNDAEVIVSTWGMTPTTQSSVLRILRKKLGIVDDEAMLVAKARAFEVLRDYALLLES